MNIRSMLRVMIFTATFLLTASTYFCQDSLEVMAKDSTILAKTDSIETRTVLKKINHHDTSDHTLKIIQDERINVLNQIVKDSPYKHDGFRIQLVFGPQNLVNSTKNRFEARYSLATYKDFLAPNFRLRVGDFPTRQIADKYLHDIKKHFTKAYIVKDKIKVPRKYR